MPRYRIEQVADGRYKEQFIIVNARDRDLVWSHNHWTDREESSAHPDSFPDRAAAAEYARQVFGELEN
jgi:hypothetical protein